MIKSIEVVDASGNVYHSTYPKRAKGLVKHGRARFVSESRICLSCPPKIDLEDDPMNNTIPTPLEGLTVSNLLEQITAVTNQTDHLSSALRTLLAMNNGDSGECGAPGNILGQARAEAIGKIAASREETLRQVLHFYEKIYDDLMRIHFGERPAPIDAESDHNLDVAPDHDLIEKP